MKTFTDLLKKVAVGGAFIASATFSLAPTAAQADFPGAHPAYRHALGDLRVARRNIAVDSYKRGVDNQEDQALDMIDAAIGDIKAAGIKDGKPMRDALLDPNLVHDRQGRLHRALRALRDARRDAHQEEINSAARGLRFHAERDIAGAIIHVARAVQDNAR